MRRGYQSERNLVINDIGIFDFTLKGFFMSTQKEIDGLEEIIKGIIKGFGLGSLATALNNACCFGEIFEETGIEITNLQLAQLFDDVITPFLELSKEIEAN